MMSCCQSCRECMACKFFKVLAALLLTVALVVATIGAWKLNYPLVKIGAPDSSLAVLTFVITLALWLKISKKACPCSKVPCCSHCGMFPCMCSEMKGMKK